MEVFSRVQTDLQSNGLWRPIKEVLFSVELNFLDSSVANVKLETGFKLTIACKLSLHHSFWFCVVKAMKCKLITLNFCYLSWLCFGVKFGT